MTKCNSSLEISVSSANVLRRLSAVRTEARLADTTGRVEKTSSYGARPCTLVLYTWTHSRYVMRSETSSQYNWSCAKWCQIACAVCETWPFLCTCCIMHWFTCCVMYVRHWYGQWTQQRASKALRLHPHLWSIRSVESVYHVTLLLLMTVQLLTVLSRQSLQRGTLCPCLATCVPLVQWRQQHCVNCRHLQIEEASTM